MWGGIWRFLLFPIFLWFSGSILGVVGMGGVGGGVRCFADRVVVLCVQLCGSGGGGGSLWSVLVWASVGVVLPLIQLSK